MTGSSDPGPGRTAAARAVEERLVESETGPARVVLSRATDARLLLVLGHGAGGGVDAPDLVALAAELPGLGVSVARVESPWRVAGRRIAPAPARLDLGWRAVLSALRAAGELSVPYVLGGRSAGARVACRSAAQPDGGAAGVLALAFPLHPPGRPERSRAAELAGVLAAEVPLLVVQGDRDPFGRPEEFPADVPVARVAAADHSFGVARSSGTTPRRALAELTAAAAAWLTRLT
jgi:predicted alpha/beta-hydrolase family hydrolase